MSTAPTKIPFTVLWTLSPGLIGGPGSHANVHKATLETYSSTGGTVTVQAFVACYNQNGALKPHADFVASYHEKRSVIGTVPFGADPAPKAFGYLWCQNGFAPANPTNNNSVTMGPNACGNYALGRYNLQDSGIGVNETHIQVTVSGSSIGPVSDPSSYCTIARLWPVANPVTTHVDCYDNSGSLVNNSFLAALHVIPEPDPTGSSTVDGPVLASRSRCPTRRAASWSSGHRTIR